MSEELYLKEFHIDQDISELHIEKYQFDKIISLGISCCGALALRNLNLKQETYPFDWIILTPDIILDCIKNDFIKFTDLNNPQKQYDMYHFNAWCIDDKRRNYYGVQFLHEVGDSDDELVQKYTRRAERFLNVMKSDAKVIFVYCTDLYISFRMLRDKKNLYHNLLIEIANIIELKYPTLDFLILSFNTNSVFSDTKRIKNFNILCEEYMRPDNIYNEYYRKYRSFIVKLFDKMFLTQD
jgi:hypothetical protein